MNIIKHILLYIVQGSGQSVAVLERRIGWQRLFVLISVREHRCTNRHVLHVMVSDLTWSVLISSALTRLIILLFIVFLLERQLNSLVLCSASVTWASIPPQPCQTLKKENESKCILPCQVIWFCFLCQLQIFTILFWKNNNDKTLNMVPQFRGKKELKHPKDAHQ